MAAEEPRQGGWLNELLDAALRLLRVRRTLRLGLDYVTLTLALLRAEITEETSRLGRLAAAAVLGVFFLFLTLLFSELMVLALAWDGPRRIPVALGLAALDLLALLATLAWGWHLVRLKARRFRHSRAEWQRNLDWVRQKLS